MTSPSDRGLRWGFASYSEDFSAPGDRRRFAFWAQQRGVAPRRATSEDGFDVVVISAKADISYWMSRPPGGAKLVYDMVDSYLALPGTDLKSRLRGSAKFLWRENARWLPDYQEGIRAMCRRADAVVCVTEEQRSMLLELNDNVHVVLDAHDELAGAPKADFARGDGTLHLVWEGLPANLPQFGVVADALEELSRTQPVHLHLVTALEYANYTGRLVRGMAQREARKLPVPTSIYQWHLRTFPAIAKACDIAVIPLDLEDPLARGKPQNKLLGLWQLGLPTVASATPAYRRAMDAAGQPELCVDPDGWVQALRRLADDEDARHQAAARGLAHVHEHHTPQGLVERWDRVFESIL